MKHTIEVNGIQVYAFHGCLEEEAKIGGRYEVDVSFDMDFSTAASTDELDKTISYVDINRIVAEEMAIRSKLIEHVGQRIFSRIHSAFPQVYRLSVKVIKINPPINGDVRDTAIIIEDSWK